MKSSYIFQRFTKNLYKTKPELSLEPAHVHERRNISSNSSLSFFFLKPSKKTRKAIYFYMYFVNCYTVTFYFSVAPRCRKPIDYRLSLSSVCFFSSDL